MTAPGTSRIHIGNKGNKGSKIGTAVMLVLVLGGAIGGYLFWSDRDGLVKHVRERSRLALPAAMVLEWQGPRDDPETLVVLREAMEKAESPRLRAACAEALGAQKDPEQVAFIGQVALDDASPAVRAAAVRALAALGHFSARKYVDIALDDPDLEVQQAACHAVGILGLRDLAGRVIQRLNHHDGDLQRAAKAGLDRFLPEGRSFGFSSTEWNKWDQGEYDVTDAPAD